MKLNKLVTIALMASGVLFGNIAHAATDEERGFEIRTAYYEQHGAVYGEMQVTALRDDLVVNRITVNRGNCRESLESSGYDKAYKYGQARIYKFYDCPRMLAINVKTNTGEWNFSDK